jgi:hypothetical protein
MNDNSDDMRDDYSELFAAAIAKGTAVRGKYYGLNQNRLKLGLAVAKVFPSAADVNAALRRNFDAAKHMRPSHINTA